jgi:hypothetical protein
MQVQQHEIRSLLLIQGQGFGGVGRRHDLIARCRQPPAKRADVRKLVIDNQDSRLRDRGRDH